MDIDVRFTYNEQCVPKSKVDKVFVEDDSTDKELHEQIMYHFRMFFDNKYITNIKYKILSENK